MTKDAWNGMTRVTCFDLTTGLIDGYKDCLLRIEASPNNTDVSMTIDKLQYLARSIATVLANTREGTTTTS